MSLDLDPISSRARLFNGYAGAEQDFYARASARDVPALVAEVEQLRKELQHVERTRHSNRVLGAEVERLRRVEQAARKVHTNGGHYPTHLGGCIGVLSQPSCPCGIGDLAFAVMALDQPDGAG